MSTPWFRMSGVVLDSSDASALADFYRRLLGWEVRYEDPGWVMLKSPNDGPGLSFASESTFVPPAWPSQVELQQMQIHLDIEVDNLELAGAHAIECGAVLAEFQPQEHVRVYFDPAGHPFCLWVRVPE
jgi:catechol 2,3-dioxygenase-like lactoylglutathione lyase family enzyme